MYDTLSALTIREGIFNGNSGIIYAHIIDNDKFAAISVKNDIVSANIYDTNAEPIQFNVPVNNSNDYVFSVSENDSFYFIVTKNGKNEYYRLNGSQFTKQRLRPNSIQPILEYNGSSLSLFVSPNDVISTVNTEKERRIDDIALNEARLSERDVEDIKLLLCVSADVFDYTAGDTDINILARRMLYSQNNFKYIMGREPEITSVGNSLKLCRYDYINAAAQKVFRIDIPKPRLGELTEYGYCCHNGTVYYTGGYDMYFATEVRDIVKIYNYSASAYYVIFTDSYSENGNIPVTEYSTAIVKRDNSGYYISSIHMNGDMSDANAQEDVISQDKRLPVSIFFAVAAIAAAMVIRAIFI